MPVYVKAVLRQFHHDAPLCLKYQPATHGPPTYQTTIQRPIPPNKFPRLNAKGVHWVQQAVGCLLFYALITESTMLVSLQYIVLVQPTNTKHTVKALTKLFKCMSTQLDTEITLNKSDTILYIDSDALYLLVSGCRSRSGSFYYVNNKIHSIGQYTYSTKL